MSSRYSCLEECRWEQTLEFLAGQGVIEALMNVIATSADVECKTQACETLSTLLFRGGRSTNLSRLVQDRQGRIAKEFGEPAKRGFKVLVDLLQQSDMKLTAAVCRAVWNLASRNAHTQMQCAMHNALGLLLRVIQNSSAGEALVPAIGALWSVIEKHPSNSSAVIRAKGVAYFSSFLSTTRSMEVHYVAMGVLSCMCWSSVTTSKRAKAKGKEEDGKKLDAREQFVECTGFQRSLTLLDLYIKESREAAASVGSTEMGVAGLKHTDVLCKVCELLASSVGSSMVRAQKVITEAGERLLSLVEHPHLDVRIQAVNVIVAALSVTSDGHVDELQEMQRCMGHLDAIPKLIRVLCTEKHPCLLQSVLLALCWLCSKNTHHKQVVYPQFESMAISVSYLLDQVVAEKIGATCLFDLLQGIEHLVDRSASPPSKPAPANHYLSQAKKQTVHPFSVCLLQPTENTNGLQLLLKTMCRGVDNKKSDSKDDPSITVRRCKVQAARVLAHVMAGTPTLQEEFYRSRGIQMTEMALRSYTETIVPNASQQKKALDNAFIMAVASVFQVACYLPPHAHNLQMLKDVQGAQRAVMALRQLRAPQAAKPAAAQAPAPAQQQQQPQQQQPAQPQTQTQPQASPVHAHPHASPHMARHGYAQHYMRPHPGRHPHPSHPQRFHHPPHAHARHQQPPPPHPQQPPPSHPAPAPSQHQKQTVSGNAPITIE